MDAKQTDELILLAKRMAGSEVDYRRAYEQHGGDRIETGRAWDKMRRAGDAIRDFFCNLEESV